MAMLRLNERRCYSWHHSAQNGHCCTHIISPSSTAYCLPICSTYRSISTQLNWQKPTILHKYSYYRHSEVGLKFSQCHVDRQSWQINLIREAAGINTQTHAHLHTHRRKHSRCKLICKFGKKSLKIFIQKNKLTQVYAEPHPSALNMTLPASAAQRVPLLIGICYRRPRSAANQPHAAAAVDRRSR